MKGAKKHSKVKVRGGTTVGLVSSRIAAVVAQYRQHAPKAPINMCFAPCPGLVLTVYRGHFSWIDGYIPGWAQARSAITHIFNPARVPLRVRWIGGKETE